VNVTRAGKDLRELQTQAAQRLAPHVPAVLDKVAELARLGDPKSAQLALAYAIGTPQPGTRVNLPGLAAGANLTARAEAIVVAMADGSITVETGERLLRAFDAVARVAAIDELAARIDALEGKKLLTVEADEVRALA
jgi:hypothetical protein